jgi:hypothetical protein
MQETQDKPKVSRRDCLHRFRGGSLAALLVRTGAGKVGTAGPGPAAPTRAITQNKAKLGGTGVCG